MADEEQDQPISAPPASQRADARRIVAARGLRQFAYGMMGITLAVALTASGYSPVAIGALITIAAAGDFCATYVVGIAADHWGGGARSLSSLSSWPSREASSP